MNTSPDILRLRVLLCFLSEDETASTVTGISRTLGEPKYKITRILSALEQEKLIDKSNPRNPKLTEYGLQEAKRYEERISVIFNHLIYEGLDTESACHDALYWSMCSTEKSMQAIRATEERYRVKYNLRDKSRFSGSLFCKQIKDGTYQFPFVIYTDKIENKTNISPANDYLEHPCTLIVKDGVGTIQFQAINTFSAGRKRNKVIQNLQYIDADLFIRAEKNANIFSLPASALSFINIGTGVGQILHGSICLKIQYAEQNTIAEDTAIFTILI
ncbi:MAG: hypothetical protein NC397_08150 [Clostridium sp.]|nr:hypothetical protein [Clostridium sp.]